MNKFNTVLILILTMLFVMTTQAQMNETWVDYENNNQLTLADDGTFQFNNSLASTQGSYAVTNNVLMLQDTLGNNYQYTVQNFNNDSMTLVDNLGISYRYVKSLTDTTNLQTQRSTNFPWDQSQYLNVLAEKNGHQWRERENQLYVEFLQLLIGQKATISEVNQMRQDFIREFLADPIKAMNDVKAMDSSMEQIYSTHDLEKIAMMREVLAAVFYETIQHQPEMNNYAFVQILNKHIKILSVDNISKLNLSNQDAQAYINFLQFQMMLTGQNYQLSQQERMAMQMYLANQFPQLPLEQKQALAFASFIWNNVQRQWSSMSAGEQQQYITQVQNQLNIQNQQLNSNYVNNFWNSTSYQNFDNTAALTVREYEAEMQANRNMFQMMENSMTEQHVVMMNIINAGSDSGYEYVVEYNDY